MRTQAPKRYSSGEVRSRVIRSQLDGLDKRRQSMTQQISTDGAETSNVYRFRLATDASQNKTLMNTLESKNLAAYAVARRTLSLMLTASVASSRHSASFLNISGSKTASVPDRRQVSIQDATIR